MRRVWDWATIALAICVLAFAAALAAVWEVLTAPFRPWLNDKIKKGEW